MNCYVCDSLTDPGCEDDYNTPIKHLTACPAHLSDGCSKEKSGGKVDGSPEIKGDNYFALFYRGILKLVLPIFILSGISN